MFSNKFKKLLKKETQLYLKLNDKNRIIIVNCYDDKFRVRLFDKNCPIPFKKQIKKILKTRDSFSEQTEIELEYYSENDLYLCTFQEDLRLFETYDSLFANGKTPEEAFFGMLDKYNTLVKHIKEKAKKLKII